MTQEMEVIRQLDELETLAGTMYAEAAGDWKEGNSSVEERIAVGCIVRNRVAQHLRFRAKTQSYKAVCLAPKQFSCWNPGPDRNHVRLIEQMRKLLNHETIDPVLRETLFLAQGVINNTLLDRTGGATFYYAPKGMVPKGTRPSWAEGQTVLAEIGDQLFFKL